MPNRIVIGDRSLMHHYHPESKRAPMQWEGFAGNEEVETEVQKWLRQQSKNFCAVGSDALVKRWDKFIDVGAGYAEKYIFFPGSNITNFSFYINL
jgi:hypothetical protein